MQRGSVLMVHGNGPISIGGIWRLRMLGDQPLGRALYTSTINDYPPPIVQCMGGVVGLLFAE